MGKEERRFNENKQNNFRECKTCGTQIEYIPRRVKCCSCYKKQTNWIKPSEEVKFIDDE